MKSADTTPTTDEVIDRFNRAFRERDGTRCVGHDASFGSWTALIDDTTSHFEVGMRLVDGKIVEAAGYSKTAPTVAALDR